MRMKPAHIGSPIPGVTNCMFGGSPHCARSFRRAWIQILKDSIYLLDHAEGGQMLCSLAVYPFFISLPLTQIIPGGTNVKADTSVRALTILPIKRQKENSFVLCCCLQGIFLNQSCHDVCLHPICPVLFSQPSNKLFFVVSAPRIDYVWRCFCLCTRHKPA